MSFKIVANNGKNKVVASSTIQRGISPGGQMMTTSNLVGADLQEGMLSGLFNEDNPQQIQAVYRDIYFHDPIAGAAVDLKATMPWSDFTITGGTEDQLKVFNEAIEKLNLKTAHTEMSIDQMVTGAFVGSLVHHNNELVDIIPFDYGYTTVHPNLLYSEDPSLQIEISDAVREYANSKIPGIMDSHKRIPPDLMQALRTAKIIDLDPITTLYLPRTTMSTVQYGVSYFRRIVPIYLLERVLYRGTISEAQRRQRSTLHIQAGDEDWVPTSAELQELVALFQSTEMDPISATVATRNSIQTQEIRCLSYDTLVNTDAGLKTIGSMFKGRHIEGREVKTDDSALNHKGEYAKIDTVIYQGKKRVLNVVLSDGTRLRPTKNHKFLTIDSNLGLTLGTIQNVDYVLKVTQSNVRHNEYELGIPGDLVYNALRSRDVTKRNEKVNGVRGSVLLDDLGNRVFIPSGYTNLVRHFKDNVSCMSYKNYRAGKYNELLTIIKKVSKTLYTNICILLEREYAFLKPVSITRGKKVKTYDLHMDESNAPLFCIENGIVTKNSAGDFWRWTDVSEQLSYAKMRALGINESFLSGESTYGTMEMALSVFIEDLRTYRERETRRIYYDKIFPLISLVNDFHSETQNASKVMASKSTLFRALNDKDNLLIPEIHWHKQLRPEADQDYLGILSTLEEKGVPVPLRMWAAAGGYDLEKLLNDKESDAEMVKRIAEYKQATGGSGEGEGENDEYASMRGSPLGLNRDFGEDFEIVGRTKTGKPKYIHNQKQAHAKANEAGAKALAALADEAHLRATAKKARGNK